MVDRGVFAVPELQREFVWNARKACDLLDSLYRRYPIGTVLVWKTGRRNENQLRKSLHILPPFNVRNSHIYFLIDGQQRLSVLWHVLQGSAKAVQNADGKVLDFGKIYFDPYAGDDEASFVYRLRLNAELDGRAIGVVDMLSASWRHRLGSQGKRAVARITECRRRILSYRLLVVFCETDDRAEVRETFIRINSLGMRIGAADQAFARASRFKMRGLVRESQHSLGNGFSKIKRTTILQVVSMALGGRDLGQRAIDGMVARLERDEEARKEFNKAWPRLRTAIGMAADYLVSELKVPNFGFLPSEPMVAILALYFFHNGNVRPPRAAKAKLQRWFWATAVGARYTGRGYRPNLTSDATFVKRLAENPMTPMTLGPRVPLSTLARVDYSRPGPVSNGFFCLLRQHGPRYLEDGGEIPLGEISTRANRSDKHHVFPRALLRNQGLGPDKFNSLLNICYLVARENQSVGQKRPRHYFTEVPGNRRTRNIALRSHLVPSVSGTGIWDVNVKRGFKTFCDQRARLLAKEFERVAGGKLFERG